MAARDPEGLPYRYHVWAPLGYASYYDYRVHGYGRRPPGEAVTPQQRREYRGHAGLPELLAAVNRVHVSADGRRGPFIRELNFAGHRRGSGGRWQVIRADASLANGQVWRFYLRGGAASHQSLILLKTAMRNPGALRRRDGGAPPGGFPPDRVAYPGPTGEGGEVAGGEFGPEGPSEPDEEEGEAEEWDAEYEWDDYYFDYDEGYDWDVPYGTASSIAEFSE